LEGLGEPGPQHDEREDEPHVGGFPHRPDRVREERAGTLAALGATRDEVPEPGAEVGTAEQRVRGDPEHQDHRDDVAPPTPPVPSDGITPSSAGPYGPPASIAASLARNRRLIMRRINTSV